jgi:hypothetical protein
LLKGSKNIRGELQMIRRVDFHPKTAFMLEKAGWVEGRNTPTNAWRDALVEDGYKWSNTAEAFLNDFGGLVVSPVKDKEAVFGSGILVVDPLLCLGEQERIKQRGYALKEELCPVGEWLGESIILISPRGLVYAETTFQVLLLGRTFIDALEVIVRAYRYPEVIEGTAWWLENKK